MMDYLYSVVAGLAIAGIILVLQPAPPHQQTIVVIAPNGGAIAPTTDRERAALALLGAIGNDRPTKEIIHEVVNWSYSEDGCEHGCTENGAPRLSALERNNFWNTTQSGFNEDGCNMADCVRHYATFEDGIAATAHTLTNGLYGDVVAALLANDPEGFKRALWASPWAASHYGYGSGWVEETQHPSVSLPNQSYTAPPLQVAGAGCLEPNVTSAYEHSPGLQNVVIPPGADWSFNENWQIANDQTYCPGQNFVGGGVCNMASRYSNVARTLGLPVSSQYHGYVYDSAVPQEDNLAIMSSGGRGGQDLVIKNTSNRTVIISALLEGGQLIVSGGFQ